MDPTTFHSFTSNIGLNIPYSYINQLNMVSHPRDLSIPHPSRPVYAPNWENHQNQSLLDLKVVMSFFEKFYSPGTYLSLGSKRREHVRDMFKVMFVENLTLGNENMNFCDENAKLHPENRDL